MAGWAHFTLLFFSCLLTLTHSIETSTLHQTYTTFPASMFGNCANGKSDGPCNFALGRISLVDFPNFNQSWTWGSAVLHLKLYSNTTSCDANKLAVVGVTASNWGVDSTPFAQRPNPADSTFLRCVPCFTNTIDVYINVLPSLWLYIGSPALYRYTSFTVASTDPNFYLQVQSMVLELYTGLSSCFDPLLQELPLPAAAVCPTAQGLIPNPGRGPLPGSWEPPSSARGYLQLAGPAPNVAPYTLLHTLMAEVGTSTWDVHNIRDDDINVIHPLYNTNEQQEGYVVFEGVEAMANTLATPGGRVWVSFDMSAFSPASLLDGGYSLLVTASAISDAASLASLLSASTPFSQRPLGTPLSCLSFPPNTDSGSISPITAAIDLTLPVQQALSGTPTPTNVRVAVRFSFHDQLWFVGGGWGQVRLRNLQLLGVVCNATSSRGYCVPNTQMEWCNGTRAPYHNPTAPPTTISPTPINYDITPATWLQVNTTQLNTLTHTVLLPVPTTTTTTTTTLAPKQDLRVLEGSDSEWIVYRGGGWSSQSGAQPIPTTMSALQATIPTSVLSQLASHLQSEMSGVRVSLTLRQTCDDNAPYRLDGWPKAVLALQVAQTLVGCTTILPCLQATNVSWLISQSIIAAVQGAPLAPNSTLTLPLQVWPLNQQQQPYIVQNIYVTAETGPLTCTQPNQNCSTIPFGPYPKFPSAAPPRSVTVIVVVVIVAIVVVIAAMYLFARYKRKSASKEKLPLLTRADVPTPAPQQAPVISDL